MLVNLRLHLNSEEGLTILKFQIVEALISVPLNHLQ